MMPRHLNRSDSKKEKFSIQGLRKNFNDFTEVFALVLPLLQPSLNIIFITYGFTVFQSAMNSLTPRFTGGIIDIVTRSTNEQDLITHLIKMFVFSITINEIQKFGRKINDKARLQINKNLRGEVYRRVLDCDMEFFDETSTSEATQIINSGVEAALRLTLSQVTNMMQIFIGIVTNLYFMYQICPDLISLVIILTPIKFSLVFFNVRRRHRFNGPMRELHNQVWQLPLQAIQNIGIVKCFSTENKEHQEYMDAQQKLYDMESKIKDDRAWMDFIHSVLNEGLKVALFYFGGVRVFKGLMTVGELSTFSMYALGFMSTGASIKNAVEDIFNEATNSSQLLKILKRSQNTKLNHAESVSKEELKGTISINNVSFCYPSKPHVEVLHNISFQMKEGESVAFVGISGSGKTTMAYLLQNLYTPTQGRIMVGEKDLREFDIRHLHTNMGYVPQEPVLFDKTIERNIAYGLHREYTSDELDTAIKMSNSQFVWNKGKFPEGVQTKIGSGPDQTKLSGGQKQRIAIARAFVKNPKLLILDEPTSALDGESEAQVQQAIDDLVNLGDRTVVVIAHRLSTIIKCQRIVVFDNGRIVEQGTHKELIEMDGTYKKLFNFQLESLKQI